MPNVRDRQCTLYRRRRKRASRSLKQQTDKILALEKENGTLVCDSLLRSSTRKTL
jgi:hypothetical protein